MPSKGLRGSCSFEMYPRATYGPRAAGWEGGALSAGDGRCCWQCSSLAKIFVALLEKSQLNIEFLREWKELHCPMQSDHWYFGYRFRRFSTNYEILLLSSSFMSVRLSSRMERSGSSGGFSRNLISECFLKICRENSSFVKIRQE